jgi:hypothetical protein
VYTGDWCSNVREGDHLIDPSVDERVILKLIFEKWVGGHGVDQADSV